MSEGGDEEDATVYIITSVAEDKVVPDGSHPLAGMVLCFELKVTEVRKATAEETERGRVRGKRSLEAVGEDENDDKPHTLH